MSKKILLWLFATLLLGATAMQAKTPISGTVIDSKGDPVVGVNIIEKEVTGGSVTDVMGRFTIEATSPDAMLVFTFVGMAPIEIKAADADGKTLTLSQNSNQLSQVVVVGYGTATKEKLTGSVTSVGEREFRQGINTTATSLIAGKVAGVNITPNGGRAGDGNQIRIRGGASLNASNDPLIIVDGLPLSNDGISGLTNPLSSVNPNDIESISILKDAAATAIYGSRASNGVVIITTKKGTSGESGKKVSIDFTTNNSLATVARKVNTLTGSEFKQLVENYPNYTNQAQKDLYLGYLGYVSQIKNGNEVRSYANTDWQDEIYRPAFTSDNVLSISGAPRYLPYRVSVGYMTQDGLLKTDNVQRTTVSVALNPSLLKNHLNINVNAKGTYTSSHFGNGDAIGAALRMDPTKPVYNPLADENDLFNGYWQWTTDAAGRVPNGMATANPVSLLNSKTDIGTALRSFGNLQIDYKIHGFEDLRANINLGYDVANGYGSVVREEWAPSTFFGLGERSKYNQLRTDLMLEAYLAYSKDIGKHHVDAMAGYTYQSYKTTDNNYVKYFYDNTMDSSSIPTFPTNIEEHVLLSFYGRANYSYDDRYIVQLSIRRDGSSRFSEQHRWGWFPSASAAWRISNEAFLKNNKVISDLKLRVGWGMTGQQDGIGNYEYLSRYSQSTNTAMIQFGDQFYYMWRPAGYDIDRHWEATTTYNAGLEFGFLKNRITASVDYYFKKTTDLLNEVPLSMGSNFKNRIVKNIGEMENSGIEFNINASVLEHKDFSLDLGYNFTWNTTKITKLTLNDNDPSYPGALTGGISGGTGNTVLIHSTGYTPNTFYVYKQLYDAKGNPIEGAYADRNGDGVINESDLYHYKSSAPDFFMGFNFTLRWKNLSLSSSLRASIGNYMYYNTASDVSNYSQIINPNNFLSNTTNDIYSSTFNTRQLLSDYYVQNASFLKMDYITLAYDFGRLGNVVGLSLNFTVQNVFTITKYEGIDPENGSGIDNNYYPFPRTFNLGIKLRY
ncbi:MAG: TonB-dependent receptor [Bacteroidales bacterium]|jgi:iron complex outermembrane receptor protein|nr:TonB-dependent receptor [Bacteroidales bacterium]